MAHDNDYQMDQLVKITFEDMPYWVMPRYIHHYVHNNYEKFSLKLIKNLIKQDETFLDIGGHYGAYSIYAAEKCGAKVIAMEPVNENFEIFTKNINENNLQKQIETHNAAASNEDTEAEFNIPWASDSAGFYDHPLAETYKKQKVQVRNVDNLVNGRKIDFIKIDTEGHELTVLAGLEETLKSNPQVKLLIEANPSCLEQAGHTTEELLQYLADRADKELYVVDEDAFTLRRVTDDIENWSKYIHGYANILCVPKTSVKFPLFVCHSGEFGGGELALLENVLALRERGVYSHVVLPNNGPLRDALIDLGVSHSVLSYGFWHKPENSTQYEELLNFESSALIADLAGQINPSVIVNNSIVCPWGILAARQHKLPLIWFIHEFGDLDHDIKFNYPLDDIRKFVTVQADLVVACSDAVAKVYDSKKVKTLYPLLYAAAVEVKGKESASRIFERKQSIKVLIPGRVQETKGQMDAVDAVSQLKDDGVDVELVLLGNSEGRYLRKIKAEIKKRKLNADVRYLNRVSNPFPLMKQADIVVTSSRYEAFGRVTAEAMLLGVPVIATNTGGTAELIKDGETGLLYDSGDVTQLAESIKQLGDSRKRISLAKKARAAIETVLATKANTDLLIEYLGYVNKGIDRSYSHVMSLEEARALVDSHKNRNELRRLVDEAASEKEALEQDIAQLIDEIERISKEKQAIYDSSYWSVTKPIRGVFKTGRRLRNYTLRARNRKDIENAKSVYVDSLKVVASFKRQSQVKLAVMVHLFYPESWPVIKRKLDLVKNETNFDLFVTTPDKASVPSDLVKSFPKAVIVETPNRGRDVLPFIKIAPVLAELGYESFLKLHTKRSKHRADGFDWFTHILDNLVSGDNESIKSILAKLGSESTALVAPAGEYVSLLVNFSANKHHVRGIVADVSSPEMMQKVNRRPKDYGFIAGTMFWGRFDALAPILNKAYDVENFEIESGQIDATFAHALERAFCVVPELNGKSIYETGGGVLQLVDYAAGAIPEWSDIEPVRQR